MKTNMETHYVNLETKAKEPEFNFFFDKFLRSRIDLGLESDKGYSEHLAGIKRNDRLFDEDVNNYICGLLTLLKDSKYNERAKELVSPYESSIFKKVDGKDKALKFVVYRTNADFLLVKTGMFSHKSEADMKRGSRYYAFASAYCNEIYRKRNSLVEVLEKLSIGFEKYMRILNHMIMEYLDLRTKITDHDIEMIKRFTKPEN